MAERIGGPSPVEKAWLAYEAVAKAYEAIGTSSVDDGPDWHELVVKI
jgi:hypothetical protein